MSTESASLSAVPLARPAVRRRKPAAQWMLAGFFVAIGLASSWIARTYAFGTPARMGPGFFPSWIGLLLAGAGVLIALSPAAADVADEQAPFATRLRIMATVLGSLLVFAIITPDLGLPAGVLALVLTALLARPALSAAKALGFAIALAGLATALFVGGLSLPFAVLPQ